ncbi:MAG: hypothetical protein ACREHG_03975 [Candidatus Saccharimonadales bacterium]
MMGLDEQLRRIAELEALGYTETEIAFMVGYVADETEDNVQDH